MPSLPNNLVPKEVKSVLLMHSGGLDSLVPLYLLLAHTDLQLIAQHVVLRRRQSAASQSARVSQQWDWLRSNVRDFETRKVEFFGSTRNKLDVELFLPEAAKTVVERPDLWVMTGRCHEDAEMNVPGYDQYDDDFYDICGQVYSQARVLSPVRDWPKKDLADLLPPELLRLAWGCEAPNEAGEPCGACLTCRQYDVAGLWPRVYGRSRPLTPAEIASQEAQRAARKAVLLTGPKIEKPPAKGN